MKLFSYTSTFRGIAIPTMLYRKLACLLDTRDLGPRQKPANKTNNKNPPDPSALEAAIPGEFLLMFEEIISGLPGYY